jgi:hypothetical protein
MRAAAPIMHVDKAVKFILTLLRTVSLALVLMMAANEAGAGQSFNTNYVADAHCAVGAHNSPGRSAISTPCESDNQPGDQLDFDEQGIGAGSPPPAVAPAMHLVINHVLTSHVLSSQETDDIDVRALLLPDIPYFARIEKASIVLLI